MLMYDITASPVGYENGLQTFLTFAMFVQGEKK